MDLSMLEKLLTVGEVAEMFEVPARVVRKEAKAGNIPGTIKVLNKLGFDPDVVAEWQPPEAGTRVVGARREDGRQRYRVYLTAEEATALTAQGYEIHDPREDAKVRRAARKAARAAKAGEEHAAILDETKQAIAAAPSPAEATDPFKDFGG